MKRVLILNGNGTGLESFAIRSVLEYFGYIVIMYNIGRPQDYFDIFSGKQRPCSCLCKAMRHDRFLLISSMPPL